MRHLTKQSLSLRAGAPLRFFFTCQPSTITIEGDSVLYVYLKRTTEWIYQKRPKGLTY